MTAQFEVDGVYGVRKMGDFRSEVVRVRCVKRNGRKVRLLSENGGGDVVANNRFVKNADGKGEVAYILYMRGDGEASVTMGFEIHAADKLQ